MLAPITVAIIHLLFKYCKINISVWLDFFKKWMWSMNVHKRFVSLRCGCIRRWRSMWWNDRICLTWAIGRAAGDPFLVTGIKVEKSPQPWYYQGTETAKKAHIFALYLWNALSIHETWSCFSGTFQDFAVEFYVVLFTVPGIWERSCFSAE